MARSLRSVESSHLNNLGLAFNWPVIAVTTFLIVSIGGGLSALHRSAATAFKHSEEKARQENGPAVIRVAPKPEPVIAPQPTPPAPRKTDSKVEQSRPVEPVVRKAPPAPVPPPPAAPQKEANAEPVVASPPPPTFKRLDTYSENEHLVRLQKSVPDLDLDAVSGTSEKLLERTRTESSPTDMRVAKAGDHLPLPKVQAILDVIEARSDLKGLPVLKGTACQTTYQDAESMREVSRKIRRDMRTVRGTDTSFSSYDLYHGSAIVKTLKGALNAVKGKRVGTLVQMGQAENAHVRYGLVQLLGTVETKESTADLARRALFDLSPQFREEAVQQLKPRSREETRKVLLAGFRHPWPPVAAHAAEALVALDDREAVKPLVGLLDQPDPAAPRKNEAGKWVVSELVRVNHLRNCLLCHAPSLHAKDPVRGLVPTPGEPLPELYYESRRGTFVRADVVYLRQDFSVLHPVAEPKKWPVEQRFDYLVRQRELSAGELRRSPEALPPAPTYRQREAVLFALRELTKQDLGEDSTSWLQVLRD